MFTSGTLITEPEEVAHSFQLTPSCYLSLKNVVYHFNKVLRLSNLQFAIDVAFLSKRKLLNPKRIEARMKMKHLESSFGSRRLCDSIFHSKEFLMSSISSAPQNVH